MPVPAPPQPESDAFAQGGDGERLALRDCDIDEEPVGRGVLLPDAVSLPDGVGCCVALPEPVWLAASLAVAAWEPVVVEELERLGIPLAERVDELLGVGPWLPLCVSLGEPVPLGDVDPVELCA